MGGDIPPKEWGDNFWKTMEFVLKSFEEDEYRTHEDLIGWIKSFDKVLPCTACRRNWPQTYAQDPLDPHVGSVEARLGWMNRVRNTISGEGGATTGTPFVFVAGVAAVSVAIAVFGIVAYFLLSR